MWLYHSHPQKVQYVAVLQQPSKGPVCGYITATPQKVQYVAVLQPPPKGSVCGYIIATPKRKHNETRIR